jgi:hypothetical protein
MKLLEQFSAESFEVGYLFCILTKKMIDEKRYDIALDHLKKSIEILGKENCSNPLIFSESIKIHLD